MKRRFWAAAMLFACGTIGLAWTFSELSARESKSDAKDKKRADEKEAAKDVFGLTKVWHFDLQISAKEYEKIQPTGGMRLPFGPPGPPPAEKPAEKPGEKPTDVHKGGGFGVEFPWIEGAFTADGKTYKNVGFRYKGNASYLASSRGLKRNLKIDLDHFDDDLRFNGLKTINLNAGAMDATKMREILGYAVYRAAGVPAPRTALVEVTLTVPGKYDKEYLGVYTFIEQVDKTFLKDRFTNGKGVLMKPERLRNIEYLGEEWDKYAERYRPKHDPTKKEAQRVIAFSKLVDKADDEQFRKEIGSYLDVDEFLRFLAATSMVANLDSFFSLGHNYYMYLNPTTNKFVFMPWDLDLSFAGFGMSGSPEQQQDLSLTHPYAGDHKLADRLLAVKEVREQYQKLLKELSATAFTKDRLLKDIDSVDKAMKEMLVKEKKAAEARKEGGNIGFGGMMGGPFDLRSFVAKRTESVAAQAEGKSKGFVPTSGFGFGPGGPGGRGNALAKPLLEALDTDKDGKVTKDELVAGVKKFFADCDKDKKGKLDEKQIAEAINRISPRPPGFGPPGGPGPGPGGFGLGRGNGLASAIMKRADADKDGKVTLDELVAAAETLFKESDKDKKGSLDDKGVGAAISILSPPGFGPGPGGPGGFGLGNFLSKPLLEALDKDKDGKLTKDELSAGVKKFFADCDKDKKDKLDEKQIAEGINRLLPPPPGFGPPPGPGGFAFGPGNMIAPAIVKRAGADKDGKVTLDKLLAAAETLFKECDKEKSGKLDEKAVGTAFNLLVTPPQGFGPPGFGPPGEQPKEPKKESKP
jgi:spore coat protein H